MIENLIEIENTNAVSCVIYRLILLESRSKLILRDKYIR